MPLTKAEKHQLVQELTERFQTYPNFYIADTGGMTVAEMHELRGLCHAEQVPLSMIKNTLIKIALDQMEGDYAEVYPALKQTSSVFFAGEENASIPAKILKKFRKAKDKPILKAAVIETSVFLGDDQIEALSKLKSKTELIGEVIGLLQSPAKNVVSALQSGGGKLAGILKTLSEREE